MVLLAGVAAAVTVPTAPSFAGVCSQASLAAATSPSPDPACPGVRPGAPFALKGSQYNCTFNFMLRGTDGALYSLTMGQCIVPHANAEFYVGANPEGVTVWKGHSGPAVVDATGHTVAHAVYRRADDHGDRVIALLRLDRGVYYSTDVCGFGGPSIIDTSLTNTPQSITLYGQGTSDVQHARQDVLPRGAYDPVEVDTATPQESPDSGAPVMSGDREAFGIASGHFGGGSAGAGTGTLPPPLGTSNPYSGPRAGTPVYRLLPAMRGAEKALGVHLTLLRSRGGQVQRTEQ